MGTGKGCSTIGAIEQIKKEGKIDGALVLAKGSSLLENFIQELVFVCTDGRYIPSNYFSLSKDTRKSRIKKLYSDFYDFDTFEVFFKRISRMSQENIIKNYSNKVIIIDEVHNLRSQNPSEKRMMKRIYDKLHEFLHVIKNSKILLLSGTPMKDQPHEIANIMNLILPSDRQIVSDKKEFEKEYLEQDNDDKLKEYFKGRVSFLRQIKSNVDKIYEGEKIGNLQFFKVYPDIMKGIQNKTYLKVYSAEKTGENIGEDAKKSSRLYNDSKQTSSFVFPNGKYGGKGFTSNLTKIGENPIYDLDKKPKSKFNFKLKKELINAIRKNDSISIEQGLKNLGNFSSKFASTISLLLKNPNEVTFVYSELVHGGGLILFSKILELFGFKKSTGKESGKGLRYAIIYSGLTSSTERQNILDKFNSPENMYGDEIQVLLGSKVMGEGFSLKNVRQVHILTPWWNYAQTDQAIARAFRSFSHQDLEDAGVNVEIKIYQHAAIPVKDGKPVNNESIDLKMYLDSERKDIRISKIQKLLKESAFDCALNYERNRFPDSYNHQRECEYGLCDYDCDGIPKDMINNLKKDDLDFSTYNLYYSTDKIEEIENVIHSIFRTNFSVHINDIVLKVDKELNTTFFEILTTLSLFINNSIVLKNKYGINSYLKEDKDIYFLSDNLSSTPDYLNSFYTKYPSIKKYQPDILNDIVYMNFGIILNKLIQINDKIIEIQEEKNTKEIELSELSEDKDANKILAISLAIQGLDNKLSTKRREIYLRGDKKIGIIEKIPLDIQEEIFESAFLAKLIGKDENKILREWVIDLYNDFWIKQDDMYISQLLWDKYQKLRCLKDGIWTNCSKEIEKKFKENQKLKSEELEKNKHGYYGILDGGQFKIRDVSDTKKVDVKDKRKRTKETGQTCGTINKIKLINIGLTLNVEIPDEYLEKTTRAALINKSAKLLDKKNADGTRKIMLNQDRKLITDKELRQIIFLDSLKPIIKLCDFLQTEFESRNIMK